jgi:hypothetical protein
VVRHLELRLSRAGPLSSRTEAPTQVLERSPSAPVAVIVLSREPFFAFGEKPAHFSEKHSCRRICTAELLDALETLDHSPGLVH